jgi:putative membrane protein
LHEEIKIVEERKGGPITKTLVICVDRDNDVGEKADLETPIIGREALLSAATKLALADPEESDINAIFEAVRIYEELSSGEEGAEAEVVLVTGDKRVGVESDRKIGHELDDVLSKARAESAILVSDGAEDEWIIPLIQSRVKIDSVRRVVVKQSEPLESTFYVIKRLLEDPKFSRTFLPPIGLVLFLLAVSLLLELSGKALGVILGIIGIYTLLKGLGRENLIIELAESVKQSLYSGKISFVAYIVAIVFLLAGTFQGIMGYTKLEPETTENILLGIVYYIKLTIWWYVGAVLAPIVGKMMSMLIEGEKIVRHWAIVFSITASGLILWSGSECIIWLSEGNHPMGYLILFCSILGAVILSFIGVKISWYMRSTLRKEKKEGEAKIEAEESGVRD